MVLAIQDSTSPPRLSTAPAQVALSSGLTGKIEAAPEHDFGRADTLQVLAFRFLPGERNHTKTAC
jgi:hypothetical protein